MKEILLPLLLVSILLYSCEKDSVQPVSEALRQVVTEEVTLYDQQSPPIDVLDVLASEEIVLFGETHYVQEHQEFISLLLPELSRRGYRIIFDELFHCFNWMVEDYINGERTALPEFLLYFNEEIIEGIKAYNSTVSDSMKFRLVYMDLNHWTSNFPVCLEEIENVIGQQTLFSDVLSTQVDSDEYLVELSDLKRRLSEEKEAWLNTWGPKWYERISEIVSVELESARFRRDRNGRNREFVMLNNITSVLEQNPGAKAIVNAGMFHGQKETFMGQDIPRLGQLLQDFNPNIFSIAFIGMKGKRKDGFQSSSTSFNLTANASEQDLIRVIDEVAMGRSCLLSLSHELFRTEPQRLTYTTGNTVTAPIGLQFDALVTYPEITTLKSMDKYDWQ